MNQVKPLRQKHLSRLSPVMWTLQTGYPRPEIAVPIPEAQGMSEYLEVPMSGMGDAGGRYEATPINPKASPLWSNLYRIGTAGALSRVAPFGPSAFGNDNGNGSTLSSLWPFFLAFGGMAALTFLFTRR